MFTVWIEKSLIFVCLFICFGGTEPPLSTSPARTLVFLFWFSHLCAWKAREIKTFPGLIQLQGGIRAGAGVMLDQSRLELFFHHCWTWESPVSFPRCLNILCNPSSIASGYDRLSVLDGLWWRSTFKYVCCFWEQIWFPSYHGWPLLLKLSP